MEALDIRWWSRAVWEQQTCPCLEEAGCSAKRRYLEILAVRSCVSCWGCIYVGCSQRTPEPGWLKNNRSLSLSILEAEKVQVRVLTDSASGEGLIPVSSHGGRVREPCGSLYQDTNPFHGGSTLMT